MGLKFSREKPKNYLVAFFYKLDKFMPLSPKRKLKLYLDLEWIMWHFAHDYTYRIDEQDIAVEGKGFLVGKIEENAKVLDLGCGRGYVAKALLAKTDNILGVDINRNSIEHAEKLFTGTNAVFVCGDIFDYLGGNSEQKFDVIVLSHILEHIDEPEELLCKLVAFGDYFYIEVPDVETSHLNIYRKTVQTDLAYMDADHISEFDREELIGIIKNVDLEILDSEFRWGVMKFWCRKITQKFSKEKTT